MTERRLADTNLIVRHLVQDHPKHAAAAGRLFAACDRGEVVLVILPAVLAECVFVLESFYGHPRARIAEVLSGLLASPGVTIDDEAVQRNALALYAAGKAHIVDCVLAAHAVANNIAVVTFDADFKRFENVRVDTA